MKYELINLNLGENPKVREFLVGPYKIKLVENYDSLQPELSEMIRLRHTIKYVNGREGKLTTETKAKLGKFHVTAIAECEDEPESVFYEQAKGIWDLCLILSFILGRRVFLPGEERHNTINHHAFMVVPYYQASEVAAAAWSNRANFASESEKLPLWYYLSMNDTSVQQIKLMLGCVSLEIIQDLDENKIDSPRSEELERLIDAIKQEINQSQIDIDLKNALKGTVGKWGGSGPQQAFKNMLINYDLIRADIDGLPLKRVKGINGMRNDIVHKGKIRFPDWIEDSNAKRKASAFIGARFIPALVLEYLNRKFGLQQFEYVKRNTMILKEYIYNGTHQGEEIEKP